MSVMSVSFRTEWQFDEARRESSRDNQRELCSGKGEKKMDDHQPINSRGNFLLRISLEKNLFPK